MSVMKRYNFRIYPTKTQEAQIRKNFGCVRFVYNYYLNKRIIAYKEGRGIISANECGRDLTALKKTQGYEWLQEADDCSLRKAIKELDFAYKAFLKNIKNGDVAPGFPKFKSRNESRVSYSTKNNSTSCKNNVQSIEVHDNHIKLPKLGLVKCRVSRKIEGRILTATVTKVSSGKYYVSICCTDVEIKPLPKTNQIAGIKMGIKTLAVTSDGQQYENPRIYEKTEKKIAKLQKKLSRKRGGSNNSKKARLKLARAYEKLCNQKNDNLQNITTELVRKYDVICMRDENLTEMLKNRLYAKQLSDANWGKFAKLLEYKCSWYQKTFVKISNYHPSTQICSECDFRMPLASTKTLWTCEKCGTTHNRNVNAAINILNEGTKQIR